MRALVVEDVALMRELIVSVVGNEFGFDQVEEAEDGEMAWALFCETEYDFAVLDLMLPKLDGLSLARRMLLHKPWLRVLVISSECDEYSVREVTRSGVLGFVDKQDLSLEVLFAALNEVSAGHAYYSPRVQQVVSHMWQDSNAYYKLLSEREFRVARGLAQGLDDEAFFQDLGMSPSAVRRHKLNAKKKLNLCDDADLVRYAYESGFVKHKGGLDWTEVSHQKH
jgi:DNA-binding NarL/FixJ family response regulator